MTISNNYINPQKRAELGNQNDAQTALTILNNLINRSGLDADHFSRYTQTFKDAIPKAPELVLTYIYEIFNDMSKFDRITEESMDSIFIKKAAELRSNMAIVDQDFSEGEMTIVAGQTPGSSSKTAQKIIKTISNQSPDTVKTGSIKELIDENYPTRILLSRKKETFFKEVKKNATAATHNLGLKGLPASTNPHILKDKQGNLSIFLAEMLAKCAKPIVVTSKGKNHTMKANELIRLNAGDSIKIGDNIEISIQKGHTGTKLIYIFDDQDQEVPQRIFHSKDNEKTITESPLALDQTIIPEAHSDLLNQSPKIAEYREGIFNEEDDGGFASILEEGPTEDSMLEKFVQETKNFNLDDADSVIGTNPFKDFLKKILG